tara:strand:+ start:176 stop:1129 length:954 start_codon:yes stop_codon:yes gene_type:complete
MKVYILKECWDKIINYAKAAYHGEKAEIGGMSVVTQDKDGDWWIEDPQILNQEIAGTTCDLDKEDLAKYYTQMAVKYKDNNFRFCWWHSHHTMDAFWSGTDLSSIDEYGEGESDLSFALVVNLKEEYKCRISVWKPLQVHQDVELEIVGKEDVDIPLEIVTEVKAKCRTRKFNTVINRNTKQLSIGSHSWYDSRGMSSNYRLLEDDCMGLKPTESEAATFEAKWEYANGKIHEYIRQFNTGDWNMHKYKSAINHTNKQLEPYGIEIDVLNKKELQEFIEMESAPYELLHCIDGKYAEIAESLIDCASYNNMYQGVWI